MAIVALTVALTPLGAGTVRATEPPPPVYPWVAPHYMGYSISENTDRKIDIWLWDQFSTGYYRVRRAKSFYNPAHKIDHLNSQATEPIDHL